MLPPGTWDEGPRMDPVPALGEHTDAILARARHRRGRHPRAARRGGHLMDAANLSVRAGQPTGALRQGTRQRRRSRSCSIWRTPSRLPAKAEARDAIARWAAAASDADRARIVVRINDAQASCFADDLRLLRDARIASVMLPKAESADHVRAVRAAVPDARVLPLIESASGVANVQRRRRRRRRRAPGLRHARLRARPRPRHRRRPRRPRLCRQRARARVACRRPRGPGGRCHAAARRRATPARRPGLVAPPRLRRQAVHPPAPGRADPRRARARARRPSTGRAACSPPKPRHPAPPSSTAE